MNASAAPEAGTIGAIRSRAPVLALLLTVGGATAVAVLLWGHPAAAAAPVLLAVAAWAVLTAPLRAPAGILALVLLAVDDAEIANGLWSSPLAPIGDLLRRSLRTSIPGGMLPLTGAEIAVLALIAVGVWRSARGERDPGHVASPRAVIAMVLAYLAAVAAAIANGLARGGSANIAVWQTRPLVMTAALFFLFEMAFRGPIDHRALGRIIVAAAIARAVLATWIRWVIDPRDGGGPIAFVTDHGDSMLFAIACTILLAHLLEHRDRRRFATALVLVPVLLLGMIANGRRTVWLQLALVPAVFFLVGRGARWKQALARLALVSAPLVALYGAVGWSSSHPIYEPVQVVRSVIDERLDRSTWNRRVENWNLAMSMRAHPILGRGFGHEWTEWFRGDDITHIFVRYKAEPHNQILGLLLFGGAVVFTAMWAPFAMLVFLGARAYPRARTHDDRAAALSVATTAAAIAIQCFSDLGPFWHQYWVLGALALATAGKLAAATGALR